MMAEDELSAYFPSSQCVLGCAINLLSLPFAMPLYLAYGGAWLDLTCRIPGIWLEVQNSGLISKRQESEVSGC
jgi:hypothetical protein